MARLRDGPRQHPPGQPPGVHEQHLRNERAIQEASGQGVHGHARRATTTPADSSPITAIRAMDGLWPASDRSVLPAGLIFPPLPDTR
jgi:hypothetical protein